MAFFFFNVTFHAGSREENIQPCVFHSFSMINGASHYVMWGMINKRLIHQIKDKGHMAADTVGISTI